MYFWNYAFGGFVEISADFWWIMSGYTFPICRSCRVGSPEVCLQFWFFFINETRDFKRKWIYIRISFWEISCLRREVFSIPWKEWWLDLLPSSYFYSTTLNRKCLPIPNFTDLVRHHQRLVWTRIPFHLTHHLTDFLDQLIQKLAWLRQWKDGGKCV